VIVVVLLVNVVIVISVSFCF